MCQSGRFYILWLLKVLLHKVANFVSEMSSHCSFNFLDVILITSACVFNHELTEKWDLPCIRFGPF